MKQDVDNEALNSAIIEGNINKVALLLANKVDVNVVNAEDETPIYLAICKKRTDIVELLIANKADTTIINYDGDTLLHKASSTNQLDAVKLLITYQKTKIDVKNNYGATPLHLATEQGHTEIIRLLLAKGANPNTSTIGGSTTLHLAVQGNNIDCVKLLIDNGADINAKDDNGFTPLYFAADKGTCDITELLLNMRVDRADTTFNSKMLRLNPPNIIKLLCQNAVNVGDRVNQELLLNARLIYEDQKDYLVILLVLRGIIGHDTIAISPEQIQEAIQRLNTIDENKSFIENTFYHLLMNNVTSVNRTVDKSDKQIISNIKTTFNNEDLELISEVQMKVLTEMVNNKDQIREEKASLRAEQEIIKFKCAYFKDVSEVQEYLNKFKASLELISENKFIEQVIHKFVDQLPGIICADDQGNMSLTLQAITAIKHHELLSKSDNFSEELGEIFDVISSATSLKNIPSDLAKQQKWLKLPYCANENMLHNNIEDQLSIALDNQQENEVVVLGSRLIYLKKKRYSHLML